MNSSNGVKNMNPTMYDYSLPTYRAMDDYKQQQLHVLIWVFEQLTSNPNVENMIDFFTEEGLYNQLVFHQKMVLSACEFKSDELLEDYVQWRYRVIKNRNISTDYLVLENHLWIKGIQKYLFEAYASEFVSIYHSLLSYHHRFNERINMFSDTTPTNYNLLSEELFGLLIRADEDEIAHFFGTYWTTFGSTALFLDNVIKPAMIKVGEAWENNSISVTKEHVATAIIERVWSRFSDTHQRSREITKLAFVITPDEQLHKLGSKMVGRHLYQKGWKVAYLGLNENSNELFDALMEFRPQLIVLSATMAIYIPMIQGFVNELREPTSFFNAQIAVGGQAFYRTNPAIKLQNVDFQGETLKEFELFLEKL